MRDAATLETIRVHPDALFLDPQNPRFFESSSSPNHTPDTRPDAPRTQETLRRLLVQAHGAGLLAESILRMGFLPIDKIVVREFSPGKFIVIEGNRRVAAIKTILGRTAFRIIAPPRHILASLASIEAARLHSPSDSEAFDCLLIQGVRHISGVRSWGPSQQGKLIHTLTQQAGMSYRDAAAAVGMSPSRVSVLLKGFCGLAQMQSNPAFGDSAEPCLFSHFEQAYTKQAVREWLGWEEHSLRYTHHENLTFFYCCITGTPEQPPRLLARHIRDFLPRVLEHPIAQDAFTSGQSTIAEAYRLSQEGSEGYTQLARHTSELKKLVKRLGLDAAPLDGIGLEAVRQLHQLTTSLLMRGTTTG